MAPRDAAATLTSLASFATSCRTVRRPSAHNMMRLSTRGTDLLQVLSILTMERPFSFAAEDIRDEKVRLLRHSAANTMKD